MALATAEKVAQYRHRMRASGLRQAQLWVLDSSRPGFADRIRRQVVALRDHPSEADIRGFVEGAALQIEGWQ